MDINNNAEGCNAASEGRSINSDNLITSASEGDDNYESYSSGNSQSNGSSRSNSEPYQKGLGGNVCVASGAGMNRCPGGN